MRVEPSPKVVTLCEDAANIIVRNKREKCKKQENVKEQNPKVEKRRRAVPSSEAKGNDKQPVPTKPLAKVNKALWELITSPWRSAKRGRSIFDDDAPAALELDKLSSMLWHIDLASNDSSATYLTACLTDMPTFSPSVVNDDPIEVPPG
uniref:Uncharacterized protein n=1 Tax=Romanomermis culicivorax TaxID=13658 RepID=A0A915ICW4_ROMCU